MHSKWQIWDFFSSFDRGMLASFDGVLALNSFDAISMKMVKDLLLKGAGQRALYHKMATEVTKEWVEEEFHTLSLFGPSDSYFVLSAQDLSSEMVEAISGLDLQGRFMVLGFETEGTSWKKLLKEGKVRAVQIEAPRFWEQNKLLDFTCAYLRLPLSYEAKTWMLESLENSLQVFYSSCYLVKLNYLEDREISLAMVKELLTSDRMDQFALGGDFARRKFIPFFEKLVSLEGDFEKMRGLFNFLQSHLIKLADVSYLSDKPRLTKYDKDLQNSSRLWKEHELMTEIARFNRWELMCKKKEGMLWHEIREASLRPG